MARAVNFLNDLSVCVDEVINKGEKQNNQGDMIPYSDNTKDILLSLVDFVKGGMWTNNETKRFVARNFNTKQSKLGELWLSLYPDDTRSDASFRMLSAEVNKQMYSIFPNDIIKVFTTEDTEQLEIIKGVVKQYNKASLHIENTFSNDLYKYLNNLPSTAKHFTVDDCEYELECMANLSKRKMNLCLKDCNKEKLAYIYATLIKPIIFKQQFNRDRVLFATKYIEKLENVSDDFEDISEENNKTIKSEKPNESNDIKEQQVEKKKVEVEASSKSQDTLIDKDSNAIIDEYIADANEDDFAMINPEIVKLLARADARYFKNKLSSFDPSEVALTIKELREGNEELKSVYNRELRSAKQNNMVGDFVFAQGILEEIASYTQGADEGKTDPIAVAFLLDYLTDTIYTRLQGIPKESLLTTIKELKDSESSTSFLLNKMRDLDMSDIDRQRLDILIKELKKSKEDK